MAALDSPFLTAARLRSELAKCEYCQDKPCREACPADCSPADFIMAVRAGEKADFRRAAALILGSNPLGGVCGAVCPERHCVQACVHATFDHPVNILAVQASIIRRAQEMGVMPVFAAREAKNERVAVLGAGPAGLGAAALLAQHGVEVDVFERGSRAGGMIGLIPDFRLQKSILRSDLRFLHGLGRIRFHFKRNVKDPGPLLAAGYAAVVVATGLGRPLKLGVRGEERTVTWRDFLINFNDYSLKGRKVAIVGGGSVAADCAVAAARRGAAVEMICLEKPGEMPLAEGERADLDRAGVMIWGRLAVAAIGLTRGGRKTLRLQPVRLPAGRKFHPQAMVVDKAQAQLSRDYDLAVVAIGGSADFPRRKTRRVFYAGDMVNGPTSVVEAVASGKNAAQGILALVLKEGTRRRGRDTKSRAVLPGRELVPVPLAAEFFGRPILSPFLLSASPATDGYDQMKLAYEAGWPGGVMKTAFDNMSIHIPGEYMFVIGPATLGNCDNVSGHPLDRVCCEIGRLVAEYPDRLTLASTGGPVTGDDEADSRVWQANTRKLEAAGAMGIEYSLSCPQGGDGTKGDIVSQDAELAAKIIGWVLAGSDPAVPKLFKLTAAVTAIQPIVRSAMEVFARYPRCHAGITLANSFPGLGWRRGDNTRWEEGVVIGLSGEGILPISFLTLSRAAALGCQISGNGGPMNYRQAADFLALGVRSVQFCTLVLKHGVGIIGELHSGLSHLLQARGFGSVGELIGCAQPHPIREFMELSARKKISAVNRALCRHCGNCSRCPYLAITFDRRRFPETDAARCIGCSLCVQSCFAGALEMRERTAAEQAALREA